MEVEGWRPLGEVCMVGFACIEFMFCVGNSAPWFTPVDGY